MSGTPVEELTSGLAASIADCEQVDLDALPAPQLRRLMLALRAAATRLEVEIARVVHAAERAELWRQAGATSMEAWLADETCTTVRSARQQVKLADTLAAAPIVAEKMREGQLSVDNAQLLGAVVGHESFAADAEVLVELAAGAPKSTKRELEQWLAAVDADGEVQREEAMRLQRHLTFTPCDGMVAVKGLLTQEDSEFVKSALGHIAGAAYDDQTGRPHGTRLADALTDLCKAYSAGTVTGGRERPKLLLTVPFDTIVERAAARGVFVGSDVTVSGEAARRLACDAELNRLVTKGASAVLDFGTATRLASDSQFLAMSARDGGCRWPGCDRPPGWCEAHHIDEVIRDDGPTDLDNMVLLCSSHHHYAHESDFALLGDAHDLRIRCRDGTVIEAPPRGTLAQPRQGMFAIAG